MQKSALRILSCFLAMVVLFLSVLPFQAVGTEYVSKESFWNWVASSSNIAQGILSHIPIGSRDNVCANSDDGYHHSNGFIKDGQDGYFRCVCKDCGQEFRGYASDLAPAYDNYVETLPAQGYNSSGRILWQPAFSDVTNIRYVQTGNGSYAWPNKFLEIPSFVSLSSFENGFSCSFAPSDLSDYGYYYAFGCETLNFPVSGSYSVFEKGTSSFRGLQTSGIVNNLSKFHDVFSGFRHFNPSDSFPFVTSSFVEVSKNTYTYVTYACSFPVFEIIPDSALSGDTYNINTRPTSISGGNYGIIGDNGQITKVEDNSTIINETNNTFYNPATGATVPIVNWSYDYSDRSYKVTLESGDTATITYGDENITIQETTITEGDTITNNYTIYYLIDGSGSVTPPCDHAWTETNTTPATCTIPGSKLSTCSKCQQTKKDPLPALGHDWQVKQTVTTEYDDTGQLTQEGYTIYECSRCKEQYKSASGTSPPVNPSDPDASGDGVFSGIFGLLLDFLGFFFKTFKDFTKSGVQAFLKALQDGTSDIFGLLNPFDWSA